MCRTLFGFVVICVVFVTFATAPKGDSVNTFQKPDTIIPKPVLAKAQNGKLSLNLEPKSVTVVAIE